MRKSLQDEGKPTSDNTYRDACKEFVSLGMAEPIKIDPIKYKYRLTDFGCLIASCVDAMVRDIKILIQEKEKEPDLTTQK